MNPSENRTENRLEWIDHPMAELVRLSWPIAVSTLSYSVMTLVDTLFVARLGKASLAGVGLGGVAAFTLLCFLDQRESGENSIELLGKILARLFFGRRTSRRRSQYGQRRSRHGEHLGVAV